MRRRPPFNVMIVRPIIAALAAFALASAACAAPPASRPVPSPQPEPRAPDPAPRPIPVPPSANPLPPVPQPEPRPVTPDSTPDAAPPATAAERAARRVVRMAEVPASRVPVARSSSRNDTLRARALNKSVRVCSGGDVTLGTNLDPAWARMAAERLQSRFGLDDRPATLLAPLRSMVRPSDIVLLNVESAIGSGRTGSKCGPRSTNCYAFRSPPAAAPALRALTPAIVVGNIANNHARDAGDAGVDSTIAALERAGVLVTGGDTLATRVITPAGDTIGMLGFYTSTETPDARDTAAVYRHVARAAQRYPVVVVTMHLGSEGISAQRTLDRQEIFLGSIDRGNPVAFADAAVRGGAALVVGHGPHVLRGIEWREGGALIAYSLGNLLTYGPFTMRDPLNRGAVLCTTIDTTGRVRRASVTSTVQRAAGVLARDPEARAIILLDSLSRLDFPATGVRGEPDGTLRPRPRR